MPPPPMTLAWYDSAMGGFSNLVEKLPWIIRIPLQILFFMALPMLTALYMFVGIPLMIVFAIIVIIKRAIQGSVDEAKSKYNSPQQ